MNLLRKLAALLVVFTFGQSSPSPQMPLAAISVGKPVFLAGKEEIDFLFSVVNDTPAPLPYKELKRETIIIINGHDLKDSEWIFSNGPGPAEGFLAPGKTLQFGYRLTNYFKKPGSYEVTWKGKHFKSKPIVFRVVEKL